MSKSYSQPYILTENLGNNSFAWDERTSRYGHSPTLTIPALIDGTLDDVRVGKDIVFEETEDRLLHSCAGLANFVRLYFDKNSEMGVRGEGTVQNFQQKISSDDENQILMSEANSERVWLPLETFDTFGHKSMETGVLKNKGMVIFDNHNHALYFWIDAVREWRIKPGFELIHIDEHSDLWSNEHHLDLERSIQDEEYAWDFTNLSCNVGNYIVPAIESGLVGSMIRIENEYQIDEYMDYTPSVNSILNLDLDIFAPELDHIGDEKKIAITKNLMKQVKYVTIATSPYFIEQWLAIKKLHLILESKEE
jgi:UPF0489 domain